MKRRGFTLIELLVVVAIIALLVSILMPALSRARELANRAKCSGHLRSIGTNIHIYANDQKEGIPKIAKRAPNVTPTAIYNCTDYHNFTGHTGDPLKGQVKDTNNTTWFDRTYQDPSANMYLLVRYTDLTPGIFVCPSTTDKEMSLADVTANSMYSAYNIKNWQNLNCFDSFDHLSYSFADVWSQPITVSMNGQIPVIADMNPSGDTPGGGPESDSIIAGGYSNLTPDLGGSNVRDMNARAGYSDFQPIFTKVGPSGRTIDAHANSNNHNAEVSIVWFMMGNVKQSESPLVGLADDNIYTHWTKKPVSKQGTDTVQVGAWGEVKSILGAMDRDDAYLVN